MPAGPPSCGTDSIRVFLPSRSSPDGRGVMDGEDCRNTSRRAIGDVGGATNMDVLGPEMSITEDKGAEGWGSVETRASGRFERLR